MANPISEHGLGQMKPTPGKTPNPKRTVLPAPPKRKVSLNPMQQAQLNVRRMLAPQYAQADREAALQNQVIQSYTAALARELAGVAPAIGQDYSNAINAQQGMVNAAAQSLRGVNPSGDVAKLLDSIGAPQAQTDQIQGNLNNVFNGGAAVTQYNQGVSPLGALRAQGLAAESLARLQPGFVALSGRQSLATALQDQANARAKIGSQIPSLLQDQLNTFASNRAKRQQLALEAQALGLKTQNQQFTQNAKVASLKLQQDKFIAQQQKQIKDGTKIDASASRAAGYMIDKNGNPILKNGKRQILPGFNTNAQGRVVKSKTSRGAGSNGIKVTASTLKAAGKQAEIYYYGIQPKQHYDSTTQSYVAVPGTGVPGISYPVAVARLVAQFGISKTQAQRILNNYYAPDEDGRPGPKSAAAKRVKAANARARKGKDATGLGIIIP